MVSKMRQDDGQECSFSVITFQLALRTEARGGGSWAGRVDGIDRTDGSVAAM